MYKIINKLLVLFLCFSMMSTTVLATDTQGDQDNDPTTEEVVETQVVDTTDDANDVEDEVVIDVTDDQEVVEEELVDDEVEETTDETEEEELQIVEFVIPTESSDDEKNYGHHHIDVDADFTVVGLDNNRGTLPSSYSLKNELPIARDQNPYGTCWTFAAAASAESNAIKKGIADKNIDLSELAIAFFFYNKTNGDEPTGLTNGDYTRPLTDNFLNQGSNSLLSSMVISGGMGYINESLLPYSENYNVLKGYTTVDRALGWKNNSYRIDDIRWLNMSDKNTVKETLMNKGALAISYYHDDYYFNASTNSYYYSYGTSTNHAVTLVGWDDNYSASNFKSRPSGNGAWLVRNSWGSDWGNDGYFWVSYYDTSLKSGSAVLFDVVKANKNETIYQYDGGTCYNGVRYNEYSVTAGNIFTAKRNEYLNEVGFFTIEPNTSYVVEVYRGVSSNPTNGTKVSTVSGTATYAGYQSVKLPSSIQLTSGQKFSVVVKLDSATGDAYIMVDDDYSYDWIRGYSANSSGVSFIKNSSGNWNDLYSVNSSSNDYVARIRAYTVTEIEVPVTGISLDKSSFDGKIGDSFKLNVSYTPSNATSGKNVTWSSQNSNVATVTQDGTVSLVGSGSTYIVATSEGGYTASCYINVVNEVPITGITLNSYNVTLLPNETYQLVATVNPSNTTYDKTLVWYSSNSNVASVNNNGLITANGSGTAIITVGTSNGIQASCEVTVQQDTPITGVTLNKTQLSMFIGKTYQLTATIEPSNTNHDKTLTWSSSNTSVATVDQNGLITAKNVGTATITVQTSNGFTATCLLTVEINTDAEGITLNVTSATMSTAKPLKLTALVTPYDAILSTNIQWTSSNTSVATVNNEGLVTAHATGTTTITASTGTVSATCDITVVSGVVLNDNVQQLKDYINQYGEKNSSGYYYISKVLSSSNQLVTLTITNDKNNVIDFTLSNFVSVSASSSNNYVESALTSLSFDISEVGPYTTTELSWNYFQNSILSSYDGFIFADATINPETNDGTFFDSFEKSSLLSDFTYTYNGYTAQGYMKNDWNLALKEFNNFVNQSIGLNLYDLGFTGYGSSSGRWDVEPSSIEFVEENVTLEYNEKATLKVNVLPVEASNYTITYTSSNPNVVTVDSKGVITGVGLGQAVIIARLDNGLFDYCAVSVEKQIKKVELNISEVDIQMHETVNLIATITPNDTTQSKKLTWSSSNPGVATVDQNGKVVPKSLGTTTITVTTSNNLTASCVVNVIVPITGVKLDQKELVLEYNQSVVLNATVLPANTTFSKEVVWSSSDSKVATVTADGKVTAKYPGTAVITATTVNGLTDTCVVVVSSNNYLGFINITKASSSSLKLEWLLVDGASGYEISRSTDNKKFSVIKTVGSTVTSYTNTKLSSSKYYYYRIRSYTIENGKKKYSDYSEVVKSYILSTPSVKASSKSYDSIKLTWKKISKAESYTVYRYNEDKVYEEIATVTDLEYIDTGLQVGKTYKYKVRANRSAVCHGSLSSAASCAPALNTPKFTDKVGDGRGSITLVWGEVAGADAYDIYRSTKKDGKFTIIAESNTNSFVDSVDMGVTYYYKVRAKINEGEFVSKNSDVYSATTILAPTLSYTSLDYKTLQLSWTGFDYADSFEVYRSTSSSKNFKKVATIDGVEEITHVDSGLTTGKSYYYKVRTVTYNADGKKCYSPYSSVLKASTKPNPTEIAVDSVSSGITVSWEKVSGASGYTIYRSTSIDGTYKSIKSVNSKTFSYKDSGLDTNKQYFYKVRVYRTVSNKKHYSSYSQAYGDYPSPAKITKFTVTSTGAYTLRLQWKLLSNVDAYRVYRLNEYSGSYEVLGEIAADEIPYFDYVDFGKTYSYKVAAVKYRDGVEYVGDLTAAVSGKTKTAVPEFRKVEPVQINALSYDFYDNPENDGYEIYIKKGSKGKYKLSTRIYSATSQNYITVDGQKVWYSYDDGLSLGGTYYYKARAFKYDNEGNMVYSSYTSEKKATVRSNIKNAGGKWPKTIYFDHQDSSLNNGYGNAKSVSFKITSIGTETFKLKMSVKFSYMYCLYEYNEFAVLFNDYKGEHIYTYTLWFRTPYRYHYNETYTWNMTLPLDCLEYYIGGTNSPTYSIVPVDGKLPLDSLGSSEAEPGLGSVEGFLVQE